MITKAAADYAAHLEKVALWGTLGRWGLKGLGFLGKGALKVGVGLGKTVAKPAEWYLQRAGRNIAQNPKKFIPEYALKGAVGAGTVSQFNNLVSTMNPQQFYQYY